MSVGSTIAGSVDDELSAAPPPRRSRRSGLSRSALLRVLLRVAVAGALIGGLLVASVIAQTQRHRFFDHIYLIVLHNPDPTRVLGDPDAPYLNDLIAGYGLSTNYRAVAHPAQPNYMVLLSGSTQGIRDDNPHDVSGVSLLDELEQHGLTWHVYAQNFPGACFPGSSGSGGVDLVGAPGAYTRSHNPAISFTTIRRDPARCAKITPLESFDAAAANFEMIVPNGSNNMDSGAIGQGDGFLREFVPRILSSSDFSHSILFITWDEGISTDPQGGKVPLIVVRTGIKPGFRSPAAHTHRGLLRTIEETWGLGCLGASCQATTLDEFFNK